MASPKQATAIWQGETVYDVTAGSGFTVRLDGQAKSGFSPMEMVLVGLAGCIGADVADILRKKRQDVTGIEVHVQGIRASEPPRKYTDIQISFAVTGRGLDPEAVRRAIELSETKYCSVSATLQGGPRITSRFEVREAAPAEAQLS